MFVSTSIFVNSMIIVVIVVVRLRAVAVPLHCTLSDIYLRLSQRFIFPYRWMSFCTFSFISHIGGVTNHNH